MKTIKLNQALALGLVFVASTVFAQAKPDKPVDAKADTSDQTAAADEDKGLSGIIEVEQGAKHGDRQSAKFEEYREFAKGTTGKIDIRVKDKGTIVKVKADHIGQVDQSTTASVHRGGVGKLTLDYDQTPHRFAYDAKTPYWGVGSGFLRLSDTDKVGLASGGNCTASANCNQRAKEFGANINNWIMTMPSNVDIELLRKKGTVKLDISAFDPLSVNVMWSRENRTGTRPFDLAMGSTALSIEVPEPIDYTTDVGKISAEYVTKKLYASGGYTASRFTNHISSLVVDNPTSRVDSVSASSWNTTNPYTTPNATFNIGGPATARMDLYPNSMMQTIDGSVQFRDLPLKSQLALTGSLSFMRQDDDLLPYTTNTTTFMVNPTAGTGGFPPAGPSDWRNRLGIAPVIDAWSPYTLPRKTAKAGADTYLGDAKFTSEPISRLHVRAKYRVYSYETTTEQWESSGFVGADNGWRVENGVPTTNEPQAYKKNTAFGDAKYDLFSGTSVGLGYINEVMTREKREVKRMDEDTLRVTLDSKIGQTLDVKLTGSHAHRAGEYDFFEPAYGTLSRPQVVSGFFTPNQGTVAVQTVSAIPLMRKFEQANRKRDDVNFVANYNPFEELNVSASALYRKDDYHDTVYGVNGAYSRTYSADADYALKETAHLRGYGIYEESLTKQTNRGGSATGPGSSYFGPETLPWSFSDWSADSKDRTVTFGGGLKIDIVPKKLDVEFNYMEATHQGAINYKSDMGDPAAYFNSVTARPLAPTTSSGTMGSNNADANNAVYLNQDKANDYKLRTYGIKLTYKLDEAMSLVAGAMLEKFEYADFYTDGFQYAPITKLGYFGGGLFMGGLPRSYEADYTYIKFAYKF